MIRTFIAIQLPPPVQQTLGAVSAQLAEKVPERTVRWVKPELMHLTLRFLGDTAVSAVPQLASVLDEVAARHPAFSLQTDSLGCFPNTRRPRVIWIGLQGDRTAAGALKSAIDAALGALGWSPEARPFRAHLTLGRVRDSRRVQGVSWQADVPPLLIPVTAVHLVESILRPSGPTYTNRHTSALPQPAPVDQP